MTPTQVGDRSKGADLDEDCACWAEPESHSGLEEHIRSGLAGQLRLERPLTRLDEVTVQTRDVVRRHENNDCRCETEGDIQDLSDIRRALARLSDEIVFPVQGMKSEVAEKSPHRLLRRKVTPMHHKHRRRVARLWNRRRGCRGNSSVLRKDASRRESGCCREGLFVQSHPFHRLAFENLTKAIDGMNVAVFESATEDLKGPVVSKAAAAGDSWE